MDTRNPDIPQNIPGQLAAPFDGSEREGVRYQPYLELDNDKTSEMEIFDTEEEAAAVMFSQFHMLETAASNANVEVTRRDPVSFTAYFHVPGQQAKVLRGGVEWIRQ